jgi:hypothetical protein
MLSGKIVSMTRSEKLSPLPLLMGPKTQGTIGALMISCGAFLAWSGLSPVDGAMMLIGGAFLASIGGYRLLRGLS